MKNSQGDNNNNNESLLNTMGTNYDKEKIDRTQQNSKCGLYSDQDKIVNPLRSEC